MSVESIPVHVVCSFTGKKTDVFFRVFSYNGTSQKEFSGCDFAYHACEECDRCKLDAELLYSTNRSSVPSGKP